MFISVITGTRPQIIKTAPVIQAIEESGIDYEFIHTGQHYDYELSGIFIDGFNLSAPIDLEVGSGSYSYQIYAIIKKLSTHLEKSQPDCIIVPGDTTSALGAALTGFEMEIPVCHLESGLRRYDLRMHEEMNRRLIDHGSSVLFAPTPVAVRNLEREEVQGKIHQIGDTMYDVLKTRLPKYTDSSYKKEVLENTGIKLNQDFAVLTVHRKENVDDNSILSNIVSAINALDFQVIFPVHPRTRKMLNLYSLDFDKTHVRMCNPLSYDEFMCLVAASKLVISDSGGIQKECYLLNVPIVSLQTRTEWVETVEAGANVLTELQHESILSSCNNMFNKKLSNNPNIYGDGNAARKIPPILKSGNVSIPTDRRHESIDSYFQKRIRNS